MWYRIKNAVLVLSINIIVIIGIFMAQTLSSPYIDEEYSIANEETIFTMAIYDGKYITKETNGLQHVANIFVNGVVPLAMYFLSLLCLFDLINNCYERFKTEDKIIYKVLYSILAILQVAMIIIISIYVVALTIKVEILWIFATIILIKILFEGATFINILKISRYK
ncbi:hypothetical protein GCM10008908_34620 [Clostridium subterminale]|uniref:Uncharacterized protein n=1 Tax=Clostridium subterminale TaxID=1550 RepID=A0ABP3W602_CLOSU